jgi:hypothetical protein
MDAAVTNTSSKTPLGERINFRMIAVAALVMLLIGYPVYTYVEAVVNGGAKNVGGAWQVDLKSLGNFPFDDANGTVTDIPKKWRDLDGKRVILDGFMYAGNSAGDEVSEFQFVYNIAKCCFGGPPKVQERVFARSHAAVPYYGQMVRCIGTLHVGVKKNETGQTSSVFEMDVDKVEQL